MNLDDAIGQLEKIVDQIKKATFADDKTPLGNYSALKKEISLIENGESEFDAIVFGDLNDFKLLNDTAGHEAGDIAIRQVGEKIQNLFVKEIGAKCFRQSGDEFVVLLKRANIKKFKDLTAEFSSVDFTYKGNLLAAKISFGLVISDGKTAFSDLMERAETACRSAKNEGDGICVEWSREVEENSLKSFRQKCRHCGSLNKCDVPKRNKPTNLSVCSFCGENFF